jgi:hypothetical protein
MFLSDAGIGNPGFLYHYANREGVIRFAKKKNEEEQIYSSAESAMLCP